MNFYTEVIQHDPRFTSSLPCRDVMLLEPGCRASVEALITDAAAMGISLIVTETFRSQALQEHDEAIGASELKVGVHHFGLAADVCRVEQGKADWLPRDYFFLGPLSEKHGLVWGGNWGDPANLPGDPGFHDWVHVQACTLEQQPALFDGTWYPGGPEVIPVPKPSGRLNATADGEGLVNGGR